MQKKGILIDVNSCEYREVEFESKLECYYELLQCELIELYYLNLDGHE